MSRGIPLWFGSLLVALPLACTGDDGKTGPPGGVVLDLTTTPGDVLASYDVVSEITKVTINSPPKVTFTLKTAGGMPIVGLVPFWEQNSRFVRFTITKLMPGQNGDPDRWVAYVRNGGEPDYDTGSSLIDHKNGSYTFTFETDVRNVAGIPYDPSLTHRVAGQIGQLSTVPLEEQNVWLDFVPNGTPVALRRDIAVMDSCNECHDNLVFHGRRFEVEYCVQCHNPDLASGEGDFSYMIHRIHDAGTFAVLDGGVDYSEVTYPQDVSNCMKCHDPADVATPQAGNWLTKPNMSACDACHDVFSTGTHSGPAQANNSLCVLCHTPAVIAEYHVTPNATPNNPGLPAGQRSITYELVDAEVDGASNEVTIRFRIDSDGQPLDVTNLPADLVSPASMEGFRYPGLLLAWAMPQDGIASPGDYNNLGQRSAQPLSLGLDAFSPIEMVAPIGSLAFDAGTGVTTAVVMDPASQFPVGATLRAVGLQGYLQQDLNGDGSADASLHTPSAVVAVTGDKARRMVVDSQNCASCHEWFEGHGGNRVYNMDICTLCHVPNLSSSGRTIDPADNDLAALLGPDPLTYPEDAQNFKDLIHGIHSADFRTRAFEHVRGGRQGYYDWSEITFPRGASTSNCRLCHTDGSFELPLDADLLPTTVRTTMMEDGLDPDLPTVETAFQSVPNLTDWVNTPTASACFYCHTSPDAMAHMAVSGAQVSDPAVGGNGICNRTVLGGSFETCAVCHGPGKLADLAVAHGL